MCFTLYFSNSPTEIWEKLHPYFCARIGLSAQLDTQYTQYLFVRFCSQLPPCPLCPQISHACINKYFVCIQIKSFCPEGQKLLTKLLPTKYWFISTKNFAWKISWKYLLSSFTSWSKEVKVNAFWTLSCINSNTSWRICFWHFDLLPCTKVRN